MKCIKIGELTVYVSAHVPSASELSVAQRLPGLMNMMPTHAATLTAHSWNVFKRPPRIFDSTPFQRPSDGGEWMTYVDDAYMQAYDKWMKEQLVGDPDIDGKEDGMLSIALMSSLTPEQLEHAEYNTGLIGDNVVVLEYIGCEASSENWYPDHRDTSTKTAFTDDELSLILAYFDRNYKKI